MVLTEINRGPAILEALAECREWAERIAIPYRHCSADGLAFMERQLRDALLDLGNLMVGR